MSEVLTVPTSFGDIAELSSGLADRVDNDRIILYGPTPYDEGAEVGFAVLLMDGTPAIEGVGRVTAAVDGGDGRAPEIRYDIVFDNLQLDTRSEVVLERILIGRHSAYGEDDEATGEVALPEEVEEEAAAAYVEEGPVDEGAVGQGEFEEESPGAEAAAPDPSVDEAPMEVADSPMEAGVPEAAEAEAPAEEAVAEPDRVADEAPMEVAEAETHDDEAGAWDEPAPNEASEAAASDFEAGYADEEPGAHAEDEAFGADLEAAEARPQTPGFDPDATGPVDFGPPPPAAEPPAMPAPPPGFEVSHVGQPALMRPSMELAWEPTPIEREQPVAPSGLFEYGGPIPLPAHPPRPDLDPSYRVQPAPSPTSASTPPPAVEAEAAAYDETPEAAAYDETPEASAYEDAADDGDVYEAAGEAHEGEAEAPRSEATGEIEVEELEELQ